MYVSRPRSEVIESLIHIRQLFRREKIWDAAGLRRAERREAVMTDLFSNLPRTSEHPTLKTLLEVAELFSLTVGAAHALFGYELERLLALDLYLNGDRTHIERPHERLSTGEVHRSLCVCGSGEG